VDMPMHDSLSGADFDPGPQLLDGGQALAFSRDRHLTGGDFTRSKHQADLLIATLLQMKAKAAEGGYPELAVSFLLDDTYTDVPPPEIYRLAKLALTIDPAKVANVVAPGGVGSAGGASIVVLDRAGLTAVADDIR